VAVVCRSDGDTLHELEPLLAGWQGGGPGPEVDQVLLLQRGHLLNHGPQPALEGHQSVVRLARLVVEGGVGDQGGHDNVPNTVVEQPVRFPIVQGVIEVFREPDAQVLELALAGHASG